MSPAERETGGLVAADSSAPWGDLQPREEEIGASLAKELRQEAARLDRRLRDAELVDQLRFEGPGGPTYEKRAGEIYKYGFGVLDAWVSTGLIFGKLAARGRGVKAPTEVRRRLASDADERQDLVHTVIATALKEFLVEAIELGGWKVYG